MSAGAGNIAAVSKRQRRTNLIAILIGVVATAAVVVAYVGGVLERLELITLDLRFRYANSIPQHPDIVCIDIDDTTLEVVGRWPWPRDRQAPLVSIPAELGARAILVDLTWAEPELVRSVAPEHAGILTDPLEIGAADTESRYPDHELRTAIADAGNVYLVYEYPVRDAESSDEFNAAVELLQRGDEAGARRRLDTLLDRRRAQTGTDVDPDDQGLLERVRVVAALERHPTQDEEELAARLGIPLDGFLEKWFERCRIAALERLARRWLDESPERWRRDLHELFPQHYEELTGRPAGGSTPLRDALRVAFQHVLGYEATTRKPLVPLERVRLIAPQIDGIAPVYYFHARGAKRCGFVVFEPDADGVVRRMPLFGGHDGRTLVQIAFALACDELGVGPEDFTVEGQTLKLRTPKGLREELTIQLDARGRALIPWVRERNWVRDQFRHIPADAIWSLFRHRRDLQHNRELILEALAAILTDQRFADLAEHRRTIADVFKLRADIQESRYRGLDQEARLLRGYLDGLEPEVEKIERLVRESAEELRREGDRGEVASEASSDGEVGSVETLLAMIDECHEVIPELEDVIDDLTARLRNIVEGRICLIGYTATSLADMRPIPTSKSAAGVMAHANMLNGLLMGRLVHSASTASNAVIAAAFGLLVSLLGTFMRPRLASLLVLFLVVSYVALAGAIGFYRWTYWVGLTPAVGAMIVPFFGIAVYRFVFIDSERRQLATALGQYTSREIARQMADNPELCRRAELREVTSVFTDLKGFTPISERIGAERTQRVLNACLGRFTEIMLRHEAMVNKFIGDGVFAFWNPVIYPQADHARRACTTALDLLAGLDELKVEQRRCGGDVIFDEIVLRIGVATGKAIVGPCGSEQKYDYTCIGDSVNVASRLESANKFYGTQILVSDATRQQVGEAFEFRPLGGVRVKGKQQAVPVYELLGRAGQVAADVLAYARAFGEAVTRFQQRQWGAALAALEECRRQRPGDLAAQGYIEATAALQANPPGDGWIGAIELKEK